MAKRTVTVDGKKHAFEYETKTMGGGFQITPPKWANPFFVFDLERADQILTNVYRMRVIQKLGHP